jgi:hypothetical protein
MFGGTMLTVGCGIGKGDFAVAGVLQSSVPWAVYVLRAFLGSGFHSKTG